MLEIEDRWTVAPLFHVCSLAMKQVKLPSLLSCCRDSSSGMVPYCVVNCVVNGGDFRAVRI
jgi:hypothetical protein